MHPLSPQQRELIESLSERLARVPGMQAIVLGGSYARGHARPDSDIDLGLLYREGAPFAIEELALAARQVNDTPDPVVTAFYDWGPWVNGGSWLTVGGQRVDLLYKNLDQLERVISDTRAGRYQHDYGQQPPFGFYSETFLSELETCIPLYDPHGLIAPLQQSIISYPEALRTQLLQNCIGSLHSSLYAAGKAAESADAYLAGACLVRGVDSMVHALFAINRRYRVNDKTALLELAACSLVPRDFVARVRSVVGQLGSRREELMASVQAARTLMEETVTLAADGFRVDASSPAWLQQLVKAVGSLQRG